MWSKSYVNSFNGLLVSQIRCYQFKIQTADHGCSIQKSLNLSSLVFKFIFFATHHEHLYYVKHSVVWISNIKYEGYRYDGGVIGENITYRNLILAIAAELKIDESRKARCIVEGSSSPMLINNDMRVKLYLEKKKKELLALKCIHCALV